MNYIAYCSEKHLLDLIAWAKHCRGDFHFKFILERIAPVILGKKPSELLNVSIEHENEWEEFKRLFRHYSKLDLTEIRMLNGRLQVFFYHKRLLNSLLSNTKVQSFLASLYYPEEYTLDTYINTLVKKISSQSFPHEIGIFLGYPLKDVLGFMGLVTLPYKRTRGWRIYGDEDLSLNVYRQHSQARDLVKDLAQRMIR